MGAGRAVRLGAALLGAALLLGGHGGARAAAGGDPRYGKGEAVTLWVNKVGPYNNPQETYNYFELPFCKARPGAKTEHKWGGLGEVLQGNELINSHIEVGFRKDLPKTTVCSQKLTDASAAAFAKAVRNHYWYELVLDDLPVWGFVGEMGEEQGEGEGDPPLFVYTHKTFDISYNQDQVQGAPCAPSPPPNSSSWAPRRWPAPLCAPERPSPRSAPATGTQNSAPPHPPLPLLPPLPQPAPSRTPSRPLTSPSH